MVLTREFIRPGSIHACPEWRWLRAVSLRKQKRRSRATEKDPAVQEAIQYLDDMAECMDDFDWEELAERKSDETLAYSCWIDPADFRLIGPSRPGHTEIRRQAALEAYLLADADYETISIKMGLPAEAVAVYERWFYDFRSRRNQLHWISTQGFRGDVAGQSGIEFEHLLRMFGYVHGVAAVDDLLRGTTYSEITRKALRQEISDHLVKSSAVAVRGRINPISTLEAMRGTLEIEDRRHQFDVETGASFKTQKENLYYDQVEQSFGGMNWAVINLPEDIEKALPAEEKRLAVTLGYEPDLSLKIANVESSN